jgi:hypothetical protein
MKAQQHSEQTGISCLSLFFLYNSHLASKYTNTGSFTITCIQEDGKKTKQEK